MRVAVVAAFVLAGIAVGSTLALGGGPRNAYVVRGLVSDEQRRASHVDARLVNAWGLAASPTGPWWTSNEASASSTLYSAEGRKQLLTVSVDGGPTGIAYYGGKGFRISAGGKSDPARFVYACEDGMLRAWTPTVPKGWSTQAIVVADQAAEATVFRGVAIAGERVYATDFHNARVAVYDARWHRVRRAGAFVDRSIP
ncbi:MAG TPA: TIGR03118 family protein, partial [Gaiellaceae bacterium]